MIRFLKGPQVRARFCGAGQGDQRQGSTLWAKVGAALVSAREQGRDPYVAIEAIVSWEAFSRSVTEAEQLLVGAFHRTGQRGRPVVAARFTR